MKLLSIGADTKTVKGEARGYRTAILYLAPSNLSGRNVCPWATPDCIKLCLNLAGRGGFNNIQQARIAKTRYWFESPQGFTEQLENEIIAHVKACEKAGMVPAVRLNGTSDIQWARHYTANGQTLLERFPSVQFYDYTKNPRPARAHNYHVCLSYTGRNTEACSDYLIRGGTVSVVFAVKPNAPLPEYHAINGLPYRVIDGDKDDLRFLDPAGVIVGLRAKGPARNAQSPFVVAPNHTQLATV